MSVLHLVGDTIGVAVVRGTCPDDALADTARLAFADLAVHYALVGLDGDLVAADEMYTEPGRTGATGGVKVPAFFVFRCDSSTSDAPAAD